MSSPSPDRKYYLCKTITSESNGLIPDISGLSGWTAAYLSNDLCVVRDPLGVKNFQQISTNSVIPDDLPLEIPVNISQAEINALATHFSVEPIGLDIVASGRVGGN